MADGFDIVAVGVDDESAVVVGVIVQSQARRTVVARARGQRGRMERVDGGAIGRGEGQMQAMARGLAARAYPEIRLAVLA